ncbi:hypothetical protein J27TS8_27420 [Robertmurraya siralis]|uniref:Uncharacterized protein n=1 Tax=Robertmurraya siralis TaxID=77777 RepID=A0A920BU97_9BACI|nr:hypothetical protein [Robertmurraya siralis]GIN62749.1 hypothetical protein J27TS8_27420 [Robertmurraya siralis]
MKEEQENPITEVDEEITTEPESSITTEVDDIGDPASTDFSSSDIIVTSPVDPRTMTVLETGKGDIHVIHEITLGDAILSTLIMGLVLFIVLDRVIRR